MRLSTTLAKVAGLQAFGVARHVIRQSHSVSLVETMRRRKTMPNPNAHDVLYSAAQEMGWSTLTMLDICCQYIDSLDDPERFLRFVQEWVWTVDEVLSTMRSET